MRVGVLNGGGGVQVGVNVGKKKGVKVGVREGVAVKVGVEVAVSCAQATPESRRKCDEMDATRTRIADARITSRFDFRLNVSLPRDDHISLHGGGIGRHITVMRTACVRHFIHAGFHPRAHSIAVC
jgi:hypothetical protein